MHGKACIWTIDSPCAGAWKLGMHKPDALVKLLPVKAAQVRAGQDGLLACLAQHPCKHMPALDDAKSHGHPI